MSILKQEYIFFAATDNNSLAAAFVHGIFIHVLRLSYLYNLFIDDHKRVPPKGSPESRHYCILLFCILFCINFYFALLFCISGRNIFGGEAEDEAGSFVHLLAAEVYANIILYPRIKIISCPPIRINNMPGEV